jgi:hypothetical protein
LEPPLRLAILLPGGEPPMSDRGKWNAGEAMSRHLFLYIDILGFKELIDTGFDIRRIYERIDRLNAQTDNDFRCIVFSDTILVYASKAWEGAPSQGVMWLIEFAQELFYFLIALDVHMRAYITYGEFAHYELAHFEAYYGKALVLCYEREKTIKCTGVFIDDEIAALSDIFALTRFDKHSHYVHVMQTLDDVSWKYESYPYPGWMLQETGMEWWVAYMLVYLARTYRRANDSTLPDDIRLKHANAWKMASSRHDGLCRRLVEADFDFGAVIEMDWTECLRRIGTDEGAWG